MDYSEIKSSLLSVKAEATLEYVCPQLLQDHVPPNKTDYTKLLEYARAIITGIKFGNTVNQLDLNTIIRAYYNLLHQTDESDEILNLSIADLNSENGFLILHSILLTNNHDNLDAYYLKECCLKALELSISENSPYLLAILKALNLLCKKFNICDVDVNLHHIYYCLQSKVAGVRDETLILFGFCTKTLERSIDYFKVVNECWPWTNKNKFYLLSCILNQYSLAKMQTFLSFDTKQFFEGLRMGLSYKSLFASSQYLVKSLSNQGSRELIILSVEILSNGTIKEINNFYSQWFSRIYQKNDIFELLQNHKSFQAYLDPNAASGIVESCEGDCFRYVFLTIMFSKQILSLSNDLYCNMFCYFTTNCFTSPQNLQLLIFQLVADNLPHLNLENSLKFFIKFITTHNNIENSQFRNAILSKFAVIFNFISKIYDKVKSKKATSATTSIKLFFGEIQSIVSNDVFSDSYHIKIFALKLLENLLKTLYAPNIQKNAKNCNTHHNKQLGEFLIKEKIFNSELTQDSMFNILRNSHGYDDARELIVSIFRQINCNRVEESVSVCQEFCASTSIDECALSGLYAKVTLDCCAVLSDESYALNLFDTCFGSLKTNLDQFQNDPFLFCNTTAHLFGYLNVMHEIVVGIDSSKMPMHMFQEILELCDSLICVILTKLNVAIANSNISCAASFQDMDESLQILVTKSAFKCDSSDENCRKFLLMSFWLTLKACCDLATSIGCTLVETSERNQDHLQILEKCLNENVSVLLRCRHKGAIESAGVSIGKLVKCITSQHSESKAYRLLHICLDQLFENIDHISTTRRGAGLSLMLLNIVKNEIQEKRPLLHQAMENIFDRLAKSELSIRSNSAELSSSNMNCENINALTLHYLCVLVKDTELRMAMTKYYDDIMIAAMHQIDNSEWTICNAALQLFGALVPKIVGQKKSIDIGETDSWESTEITYMEIHLQLPKTCKYILNYFDRKGEKTISTRSIILFVGFLSNVDHLIKDYNECTELLENFRELFWTLLSHECEKVRKLAANCFVRGHEFRFDLPTTMLRIATFIFKIQNENFFQGIIFVITQGINKITYDWRNTMDQKTLNHFYVALREILQNNFVLPCTIKLYTRCKLLDLVILCKFSVNSKIVFDIICIQEGNNYKETSTLENEIWQEKVSMISSLQKNEIK